MKHTAYIAIGSNIGKRYENCVSAVKQLGAHPSLKLIKISPWYRSTALTLENEEQADYCNGTACFKTELSPQHFLHLLKKIEQNMGRSPTGIKWQPRIIDLDLLFFDDCQLTEKGLSIPHPELAKRMFVLKPLCDIGPHVVHPSIGKTVQSLLASCPDKPAQQPKWWSEKD